MQCEVCVRAYICRGALLNVPACVCTLHAAEDPDADTAKYTTHAVHTLVQPQHEGAHRKNRPLIMCTGVLLLVCCSTF